MLEHGALDLLLRLCGTWPAVRSDDCLTLHYCRSADRRRSPLVKPKLKRTGNVQVWHSTVLLTTTNT
jgi:hypothetical protein